MGKLTPLFLKVYEQNEKNFTIYSGTLSGL